VNERGHGSVEFAMAVGVLLLPVAVVVLAFGPWSETRVTANVMAAEAARAAVLELDQTAGNRAVIDLASDYGLPPTEVRIGWCGAAPGPLQAPSGSCPALRGTAVTVEVEVWTPTFNTPWGPIGGLWVSGEHAEPIDLYRSLD